MGSHNKGFTYISYFDILIVYVITLFKGDGIMDKEQKRKCSIILCLAAIFMLVVGNIAGRLDFIKMNAVLQEYRGLLDIIEIVISFTSVFSIILLYRQIKAEHEKSRREKTVDLLVQWSLQLKPETNMAVKIVEKFDKRQCVDMVSMSEFYVEKEIYKDIRSLLNIDICKKGKRKQKNGKVKISKEEVKKLRFLVILYLNMLESILTAWQMSIVDREVIERQFAYLYKPEEDKKCLENFRIAAGGEECFPAISGFILKLQEDRKKIIKEKGYIE